MPAAAASSFPGPAALPEAHRRFEAGLVLYLAQALGRLDAALGAPTPTQSGTDPETPARAAAALRDFYAGRVAPGELARVVDAYVRSTYWVRRYPLPARAALARARLLPAVPLRMGDLRSFESALGDLAWFIEAARDQAAGQYHDPRRHLNALVARACAQLRLPAHWARQAAEGAVEVEALCGAGWHSPGLGVPVISSWQSLLPAVADAAGVHSAKPWAGGEPTPRDLHGGPCVVPDAPLWQGAKDAQSAFAAGMALYMLQLGQGLVRAQGRGPQCLEMLRAFYRPRVWPTQLLPALSEHAAHARGRAARRFAFAARRLTTRQIDMAILVLHDFSAVLEGAITDMRHLTALRMAASDLSSEMARTLRLPRDLYHVIYIYHHESGVPAIEIEAFVGAGWMRPGRANAAPGEAQSSRISPGAL